MGGVLVRPIDGLMGRKRLVRLHLAESRQSFEGVLVGVDARHYRLANVKQIEDAGRTLEPEGEAWVPRERVLYVQVLG